MSEVLPSPVREQVPRTVEPSTDDPIAILEHALAWLDSGFSVALATLVEIRIGSSRAIGAQMAIREDGLYAGQLSGGCVEGAIVAEAGIAISQGHDREAAFGKGSTYLDIQMPCGGGIGVSIHVLRDGAAIARLLDEHRARRPVALRYDRAAESLSVETGAVAQTAADGAGYVRAFRPRVRIVVFGSGLEAETTARLAEAVGYDVERTQPRDAKALKIDEDTAVVLLHHDLLVEEAALTAALSAHPFYLGALGSRSTHARRCERLADLGYGHRDIARIRAPIGMIDRARDASTLALSILADVAAERGSADR